MFELPQEQGFIDLHTHSNASDGSDSPAQLIENAQRIGLKAIALTDHDTVSGIDEFMETAKAGNICAIPGVEISTRLYMKELHIVGLFINHRDAGLVELLTKIRVDRDARNMAMVSALNATGYDITYTELLSVACGESIGRPHIADLLIRKGYFTRPQDVFDKCLRRGTKTFIPRELLPPEEVIRAIHDAGGLAVWGHPIYRQNSERSFLRKFMKKLIGVGLDGIEAYYPSFSAEQTQIICEMAESLGLFVSGGSDYHGNNQPGLQLGFGAGELRVPTSLLKKIMERYAGLHGATV